MHFFLEIFTNKTRKKTLKISSRYEKVHIVFNVLNNNKK